jgi:NADH:ubiquinone oxidoreductase subunit K
MFKLVLIIVGMALMYTIYRNAKEIDGGDDDEMRMGGYPQT